MASPIIEEAIGVEPSPSASKWTLLINIEIHLEELEINPSRKDGDRIIAADLSLESVPIRPLLVQTTYPSVM
jgi:hypothetical protein